MKAFFTRQQYLKNECTHEQYYQQFITEEVVDRVGFYIGLVILDQSKDEHLNDIPLKNWDAIPINGLGISEKLRACGDFLTDAGKVCILKMAGKIIKNGGWHEFNKQ